ncbi:hypothetical protein V2J60_00205 [Pseudomonas alliivorans]|nr:hypothetical protein [Pseudomonas alliivorans]MEE4999835.1 hypothetical protein [Pseudomonas alliivorans]
MRVQASGTETFLYLNGIVSDKKIRLADGLVLEPTRTDCSADLFLALGKSDIDISVISLFLPLVRSQLKVRGRNGKETAMRAWNAVWDVLLLGAVTGREVMCNLQSDVPATELTPMSRLAVTNYHLRGLTLQKQTPVTEDDIVWIEQYFANARTLMDNDSFENAVHCLASYRWHSMPRARLAILWSGIEGLFGIDSEIVFRMSLYAAKFLEPESAEKQRNMFSRVKNLYKLRSKAVHGGRIKGDPALGVNESADLLRLLIRKCAEVKALPDSEHLVL